MAESGEMPARKKSSEDEKVAFYKVFAFADHRVDVALMIVGALGAVAIGAAQPLVSFLFGDVINAFAKSIGTDDVLANVSKVSLKFFYVAVGGGIGSFAQMACWTVTAERQAARIRELYLHTILRQDIGFFDTEAKTGEIVGRLSDDILLIREAIGDKVGKFIQFATTFIGSFMAAMVKGWLLTLVMLACLPALGIGIAFSIYTMSKMSSNVQVAYTEAGNVVEQTVGGIRTVVSYTGEEQAIQRYNTKLQEAYAASVKQGLASGIGIGIILCIVFSSYGFAIWYGAILILKKGYEGGDVMSVLVAVMMGGGSLGQVSPCLSAFAAGQAAAYKVFETIKRIPQIDAYDPNGIVLEDIKGEIELKDVFFKYPARPDVQIFSGFSLYVPSGKTVALVGPSGSGKSTVISLLERFYDPQAGGVYLDGIDVRKFQIKWLRAQMGLVSQEPALFATSIRDNIICGKGYASKEEIRNAIELANAAKFIDMLPKGVDTMVGQHGTQISGGQKQRIAIARAILKNPKILLLDEATSALDVESERIVQGALTNVMKSRTTVVVAHRLSTIRNADLIAVVHLGKLIEQGTHDELMKNPDGAYCQLVQMQERSKEVDSTAQKEIQKGNDRVYMDSSSRRLSVSSRRLSLKRSASIRSLSNLSSLTLSFGVTGVVDIHDRLGSEGSIEIGGTIGENKNKEHTSPLTSLASLNKPEIPVLLLGSIAAAIHGVFFPLLALLMSMIIEIFFQPPDELKKNSRFWALMSVVLGVVALITGPAQHYLFGVAGSKLIQRIRSMTFAKVVHQDISWFDDPANTSGAVGARLSTDASIVRNIVGDALALVVQNLATLVSGLTIAFYANWRLTLIILAIVPLIAFQEFITAKVFNKSIVDDKVMYEDASQVANDAIGSIRTVASFCAEDEVMEMYRRKCKAPRKHGFKLGLLSGTGLGFGNCMIYSTYALAFYLGAVFINHGNATVYEVFKVVFSLVLSSTGFSQFSTFFSDFKKSKESAASIFEMFENKPDIDSRSNEGITLDTVKGDIEFRHVSFRYPSRPDIEIFKDLCLTIPAGKTVALVGESGSGKSTVISLTERFYDPNSGCIYLDGVEIQNLNIRWLRKQMGLVSQEPVLFNETIRSNIAYGRQEEVSEDEIIAVAKAANAHSFISSLPEGYDTPVGERGVQLSGGQKQRIAIARAILKDPRILLLDEATSALDVQSERIVQDALDRVMVCRTTIVVAHRLTTIRDADVIAVVKNGGIVENGTHDMLMARPDGVYASLVALQTTSAN
nr:ABC transporter B family member 9-like [Ipomoea batatas]